MTDTRQPGVDARRSRFRLRRVPALLALLAMFALATSIPSTADAESCVTRELLDVTGYSFADTSVLVNGRQYTARGVSRLVGLRSHAESQVLVDEAIQQYFEVDPSDPEAGRAVLNVLAERLPEDAIAELLEIAIAKLPSEAAARAVARYTVCAEDRCQANHPLPAHSHCESGSAQRDHHQTHPDVVGRLTVVVISHITSNHSYAQTRPAIGLCTEAPPVGQGWTVQKMLSCGECCDSEFVALSAKASLDAQPVTILAWDTCLPTVAEAMGKGG